MKSGVVEHTNNPSTWETDIEGQGFEATYKTKPTNIPAWTREELVSPHSWLRSQ